MDLARLSGIDPAGVRMTVTGLRPGERLHERLAAAHERLEPSGQPGILLVRTEPAPGEGLASGDGSGATARAGAADGGPLGFLDALEAAGAARDDGAAVAVLRAAGCLLTDGSPSARPADPVEAAPALQSSPAAPA